MPFTFMIVHCSRLKRPGYFITTLCSPAALRHLESNTWSVNHSCDHNQCRAVTVSMTDDDGGTKQSSVLHGLQQHTLSFTYLASSRTVKKSYTQAARTHSICDNKAEQISRAVSSWLIVVVL
jgi:hypothetical protein